jgi:molecular chaperone GrpE
MKTSLEKRLKDLGVEEIDCRGMFDPHLHEALMHVDAPGHQPGEIVEVLSRGYLFHDAVIRHAKVSVAK